MTARQTPGAAVNLGLPARGEPIEALVARYLPALKDVRVGNFLPSLVFAPALVVIVSLVR